jgi:hypothetical protein
MQLIPKFESTRMLRLVHLDRNLFSEFEDLTIRRDFNQEQALLILFNSYVLDDASLMDQYQNEVEQ